ncbi:MAG TPA: hypothetical protein ENH62_05810 [Marinobacter sp.]|nr:hypothetical protein [Marinobacter sp.]
MTEQLIIRAFEKGLDCMPGAHVAWFDLPQREGPKVRCTYVTYACAGNNLADMFAWFFERVVDPLIAQAGDGGYLFWRLPERVSVQVETGRMGSERRFNIRTRIVVLNKALEEVRIADAIKAEGAIPQEIK